MQNYARTDFSWKSLIELYTQKLGEEWKKRGLEGEVTVLPKDCLISILNTGFDKNFFDVISVIRLKSISFSGYGVPQVSRGMADRVLGSADLPGHLISVLLVLIHPHGFIANWQPEIWAWTMTKDHCWSPPSTSCSPYTPLCLTCTITILCLSSLWVFSLFLFGILLFIYAGGNLFSSSLPSHSKTRYQSK